MDDLRWTKTQGLAERLRQDESCRLERNFTFHSRAPVFLKNFSEGKGHSTIGHNNGPSLDDEAALKNEENLWLIGTSEEEPVVVDGQSSLFLSIAERLSWISIKIARIHVFGQVDPKADVKQELEMPGTPSSENVAKFLRIAMSPTDLEDHLENLRATSVYDSETFGTNWARFYLWKDAIWIVGKRAYKATPVAKLADSIITKLGK